MEGIQVEYSQNEEKFNEISNRFNYISDASFYSTQVKIAAREYVNYLNQLPCEVINVNNGFNSGDTFAKRKGDKFYVNDKFVQKCINQAHKKGLFQQFGFFKVNIVLDKLQEALSGRN